MTLRFLALLCFVLVWVPASGAAARPKETSPPAQVLTAGFLAAHPDLKHRMQGIEAVERGDMAAAYKEFRSAARYADKASQAMLAEMLWRGDGVAQDRAAAYAWMDLAAERGYSGFVALREHYWSQLDERERAQAIQAGQGIYAEYEDAVAKPRLEKKLDRARREVTGSRTGFTGALTILVPGNHGGWDSIDASQYYADRYWRPQDYWQWQDEIWRAPPRGTVDVGPLEALRDTRPEP